ncbi:hypothetical protein LKV13_04140 [Borrelia sp. BU AG58]|uniref:hypothetical protein n=1 Tax=Borrelia sp. BU AG58 TaxID=2887345 RepID=UPI001E60DC5F|nr:hypothetical protein [Borrelia sp. BU AG58]UER67949.1 hypothetical protein LKV13_04140 [Borrelia sp. BU AG58]
MEPILSSVSRSKLIFLGLLLLLSCHTAGRDTSSHSGLLGDEEELSARSRGYLLGLRDDESFFLSGAFLKEDNPYFVSARESYARKDLEMASFYLNKILADKKSYSRELFSKASLFFGYVNYSRGAYDLSEHNFDCFLRYYRYSHASLRASELRYFSGDRIGAVSALRDVVESSILLEYDAGIYNFLNNKFGVNYLNLETLGFLDNSIFDMFIFKNNVFVSNIFGGLLRYDIKNNSYRVFIKDKKSIVLNGLKGFTEHKGIIYVGGGSVLYYIEDFEGSIKQVKMPLGIGFNNIQVLMGVRDGIFVGTLDSGLWFCSDLGEWTYIGLGSNRISSMYLDEGKDVLLVGTTDNSIYTVNLADFKDIRHLNFFGSKDSERNINFIKSYNGRYYVGTYGHGLFMLNLENRTYIKCEVDNNFSVEYFLDMEVRGNKLLFATFGHGLVVHDTVSGSWDYLGPRDGLLNLNLVKVLNFDNYVVLGTLNDGLVFVDESIKKQL